MGTVPTSHLEEIPGSCPVLAPCLAAGRGSQQHSHLLVGANEKLNTCHIALNGPIFFIPQINYYKLINQMLQRKVQ